MPARRCSKALAFSACGLVRQPNPAATTAKITESHEKGVCRIFADGSDFGIYLLVDRHAEAFAINRRRKLRQNSACKLHLPGRERTRLRDDLWIGSRINWSARSNVAPLNCPCLLNIAASSGYSIPSTTGSEIIPVKLRCGLASAR